MASSIDATVSSGVAVSSDNSGILQLKSGGTTIATISSTGLSTQVGAPAFSVTKSASQTVTAGVFTKVTFDTEIFDTNNNFASSTFTPTVAGYYQINIGVYSGSVTRIIATLSKNGGNYIYGNDQTTALGEQRSRLSFLIYMNGTTDYLECFALLVGGTSIGNLIENTFFNGFLARSA